jgi:nucleoside-diphosphate-sugar epimerase
MEKACARWSTPDMQITCLRIGNVAGADALLAQARGRDSADILIDRFDDGGTPLRSYIGPGTLADALMRLAEYPATLPPVLNVAAPVPVEMGVLADAAGLHWRPRATEQGQAQRITLDCTRLWSLLPVSPRAADPADMIAQLDLSRKVP